MKRRKMHHIVMHSLLVTIPILGLHSFVSTQNVIAKKQTRNRT